MDMDMDTPERKQIGTVISNFEESPVFSYLNSLSPIKPVKSMHISQTINSLSFASLPSMFTSSYVISQKQPRLLRRNCFSELSEPESSSNNGDEGNPIAGVLDAIEVSNCSVNPHEIFDPGNSTQEITIDPPTDNLELVVELPRILKYDCGSPVSNLICNDINLEPVPVVDCSSASLAQFVQDISVKSHHSFDTEVELSGLCQLNQTKEGTRRDWESLITDASDLLIFDSSTNVEPPKEQNHNAVNLEIRSPTRVSSNPTHVSSNLAEDRIDDSRKTKPIESVGPCEQHEAEELSNQPTETVEQKETDNKGYTNLSTFHSVLGTNDLSVKMDEKARDGTPFACKANAQQQRGMLRRCLVFEMAEAHKKKSEDDLSISSSISLQSDAKITSDDKELVPFKFGSPSPSMLPGIGLHLNALAATTMDRRVVIQEAVASGKQLISIPSSFVSYRCLSSDEKPLNENLAEKKSTGAEMCDASHGALMVQDTSLSAFGVCEELNQSSLNKQRRGVVDDEEYEGCKRCSCKKSKCLKLYCECFAAGIYCVEPCSCQECFNKPVHEDIVLATRKQIESRNPLAFAPKVIRNSESVAQIGEEFDKTPASSRHKRGCNCKKSSCLKKYCECFQGGVGCSISCRCKGCQNTFGRKDDSIPIGVEEGETESCEKKMVDESSPKHEMQNDEGQDSDHILPMALSLQNPSWKLQQSSVPSTRSSDQSSSSQTMKSDFPRPLPFKLNFHIIPEDETPEVLRSNSLSIAGVKNASPNSKRVRPPHNELGFQKSRKMVLQSIPSSPSFTPEHRNNDFPVKFK